MKCDEYGFINERYFNLRHYMHSMTVASLEMSDEPNLSFRYHTYLTSLNANRY